MKTFILSLLFSFPLFAQVVVFDTSSGVIEMTLNAEKAPITVKNFLNYVKSGHYDGTIFHRVINNFMIQGGGFDQQMNEKPTKAPIKNEASNGLLNQVGTIAMARTSDPNSATAQFFINVNDNASLNYTTSNPGYAVFGSVTKGMDVVNKIKMVRTGSRGMHDDVPLEPIIVKKATLK
jgi:peptidyl-prolyl cis-trans isomerase B (cyclophilin B)